jgi:enolase
VQQLLGVMHARAAAAAVSMRRAQACSTRCAAVRLGCRKHASTHRLFSTLDSISVTAAEDAVTVTIESGGASYSASAECGRAASGRGAAEAESAGAILAKVLQGMDVTDQGGMDDELVCFSCTHQRPSARCARCTSPNVCVNMQEEMRGAELAEIDGNVSAGLTAATSMVVCKAGAAAAGLPMYHHIAQLAQRPTEQFVIPIPFMAVLSGGKRSGNVLPAQDILACPNSALTYAEGNELASELLAVLGNTLHDIEGMEPEETAVGSWAPQEEDMTAAVKLAYEAIQDAGIDGRLTLGMHVAPSSGFFTGDDKYDLCKPHNSRPSRPSSDPASLPTQPVLRTAEAPPFSLATLTCPVSACARLSLCGAAVQTT